MGKNARMLAKLTRTRSLRNLVGYANHFAQGGKNFDSELTYLLNSAQRAAKKWEPVPGYRKSPKEKMFTIEQVKKFRQRNFPSTMDRARKPEGKRMVPPTAVAPNPRFLSTKRMTVGQRMTEAYLRSQH